MPRCCIMLIIPPFFFAPAATPASLYLHDIVYLFSCLQLSYSILIFGQCFSASTLYYFDFSFFFLRQRRACSILNLHNVFSLVAGLWSGNFGPFFFIFWRHCTILIFAQCFSCLCLTCGIVILTLFFAPAGSLYFRNFGSFFICPCLGLYYGDYTSIVFRRMWPTYNIIL